MSCASGCGVNGSSSRTGRFDGRPLALGATWPERAGVRELAHPRIAPPDAWPAPERRLQLDLGGEGLVRLRYASGAEDAFGLDAEHKEFPLRAEPFAVAVEIVARLPFGEPNRDRGSRSPGSRASSSCSSDSCAG